MKNSLLDRMKFVVAAWLVAGCGGAPADMPREEVWGNVTLDGQVLDNGAITFTPLGGDGPAGAAIIKDGNYRTTSALGPARGPHKVSIWSQKIIGKKIPSDDTPGLFIEQKQEIIPARYNVSSELKVEITAGGENHFDYDLRKKPGRG